MKEIISYQAGIHFFCAVFGPLKLDLGNYDEKPALLLSDHNTTKLIIATQTKHQP